MLKIKDNIDLKEIEKFGFVKGNDFYYYDCCGYTLIIITCPNRIIESCLNFDDKDYCLLYDLIQAGLVEKVEE